MQTKYGANVSAISRTYIKPNNCTNPLAFNVSSISSTIARADNKTKFRTIVKALSRTYI